MPQLLLEFFSEEIPARMQSRARQDLTTSLGNALSQAGLSYTTLTTYVTPRRLVAVVDDLPAQQAEQSEERRGPRIDAPESAIQGFLASVGLQLEDCERRETPKGTFLFATLSKPAQPTAQVLPTLVDGVLKTFPWPKSMRWGNGHMTWVRPLHTILCLFDGVPLDLNLTIPSTTSFQGHRFMAPHTLMAQNFAAYQEALRHAYVILDQDERREKIQEQLIKQTKHAYLTLRPDEHLLEEVTGLVEWPCVIMGKIDDRFMGLPEEVLITVMRHHQRYFAAVDNQGNLAPYFLTVTNFTPEDDGKTVIRGNEWVLRARLADATFFWEEDKKTPLETHAQGLERLIFHAKLGSLAQKVERVKELALRLNKDCKLALNEADIAYAGSLIKADLTTQMVTEFPELQGQIGARLAKAQGIEEPFARAISEHYAPQGQNQPVPRAPLSLVLSLADKLDTLAGFFLIEEKPTGSKDPYALRRAALGVIRIVLENDLQSFSLTQALSFALQGYAPRERENTLSELIAFFMDRFRVYMRDQGLRHDVVDAATSNRDQFVTIHHIARALHALLQDAALLPLIQTFKRAHNIVRAAKETFDSAVASPELFTQTEETMLHQGLAQATPLLSTLLQAPLPDLPLAFKTLLELRPHLDAFFDKVTVNAHDASLRLNRLVLLNQVRTLFTKVVDFSQLEG